MGEIQDADGTKIGRVWRVCDMWIAETADPRPDQRAFAKEESAVEWLHSRQMSKKDG